MNSARRILYIRKTGTRRRPAIFYEMEFSGLGLRFRQEVKKAIDRIIAYPKAWSRERGDIRKCLLHTFPYKVLYSIEEDHIFIIAIAHQHRKPDYWVDRDSP